MKPIPKDKMILRFNRYYINRDGDFIVMPIAGTRKSGYVSHPVTQILVHGWEE